jgi:molybdopterin-guanine dinucleotide biosynthesis protein B
LFDCVIIVDWSAASAPSPTKPSADAIWTCRADARGAETQYHRTRAQAEAYLRGQIMAAQARDARLLIGCDFPFAYPRGFAHALTGQADARAVWRFLQGVIADSDSNANNRFDVANDINARFGNGPFWGRPVGRNAPHLPARKTVDYTALPFAERRSIDRAIPTAQPVWKLYTTGSVGSQALMGLPMIARLAGMNGVSVWPFDECLTDVVLAEVYPSILAKAVAREVALSGAIKDAVQVQLLARAMMRQPPDVWAQMLALPHPDAREEGWILGAGFADVLEAAL